MDYARLMRAFRVLVEAVLGSSTPWSVLSGMTTRLDLKFDTFFFFEATHERKSSSHIQQSSRNQTRNKVQNKKLRTRTPRLYEPCHIEHLWAATSCWQGVHNSAELFYAPSYA